MKLKSLFAIPFLAIFAFGQTPTPTPVEDEVIRVESRLITVPVSVLDSKGQPLLGLKKEDFTISEENQSQEIALVSDAEKVPLEIALLIDVSSSVNSIFDFEKLAASQFLRDVMRTEDRATIFAIGSQPILVQSRENAEISGNAIRNVQLQRQSTAFYDSLTAATVSLQKNSPPKARRVLIVISDGDDSSSEVMLKQMAKTNKAISKQIDTLNGKQLRELLMKTRTDARSLVKDSILREMHNNDIVYYSINLAANTLQFNKISQFGQETMQYFADQTGGTAFLPKFLPVNLKEPSQNAFNVTTNQQLLKSIFNQLANELRSQYLLQYYSEGDFADEKYVKLKVGVKNGGQTRVRSRQGYFVKK